MLVASLTTCDGPLSTEAAIRILLLELRNLVESGRAGGRLNAVVLSTANDVLALSALMVRTPYAPMTLMTSYAAARTTSVGIASE